MRMDCFAWTGKKKEEGGIMWLEEKCFCTTNKSCAGCNFYKPADSVKRHEYYIFQTKIVEWLDEG